MPTITFVCHARKNNSGSLTLLGQKEAHDFGRTAFERGDHYNVILTSGLPCTNETRVFVVEGADLKFIGGNGPGHKVQPADASSLYDCPLLERMMANKNTDEDYAPLEVYYEYSPGVLAALIDLGERSSRSVRSFSTMGNYVEHMLVIGHPVYINQLIISFFGDDLPRKMRDCVLGDPALSNMNGYRFVVDNNWCATDMQDVSWKGMTALV